MGDQRWLSTNSGHLGRIMETTCPVLFSGGIGVGEMLSHPLVSCQGTPDNADTRAIPPVDADALGVSMELLEWRGQGEDISPLQLDLAWLLGAGACGTQVLLWWSPLSPCGHHVSTVPLPSHLPWPGADHAGIGARGYFELCSQVLLQLSPISRLGLLGVTWGALGSPVLGSQPGLSPLGSASVLGARSHPPRAAPPFLWGAEVSTSESTGATRVPAAAETKEQEGPVVPPPLPRRGPGATAAGIFSSDMCHLSCHRGGGGGRRLLLTLGALPRLWARRVPPSPVLLWDISTHSPPRYRLGGCRGGGRGAPLPREGYF